MGLHVLATMAPVVFGRANVRPTLAGLALAALFIAGLGPVGCGGDEAAETYTGAPREGYPEGPYGISEGSIIQNHSFVDGAGEAVTLRQIHADGDNRLLLVSTSAGWCTACIQEQPELVTRHEDWSGAGLYVLVTVFQDAEFEPADAALAAQWQSQYDLPFAVVADPDFALGEYYDSTLTPMNMFVDLDTMEIIRITTGWDPSVSDAIIQSRLH